MAYDSGITVCDIMVTFSTKSNYTWTGLVVIQRSENIVIWSVIALLYLIT
jgi:hypothetical protein